MSIIQSILGSYKAGSSTPALPAFTSVAGAWGLFNVNPVGYLGGLAAIDGDTDHEFLFKAISPYPFDWGDASDQNQPIVLKNLADQNSNANDLIAAGAARPTLQVTTPVVVSGAGTAATNGTYTYRGVFDNGAGLYPYYNLAGQPSSFFGPYSLHELGSGGDWGMYGAVPDDGLLYGSDNIGYSFPWQANWVLGDIGSNPIPTVVAGTGQGETVFNGSANGMQSSGNLFASDSQTFTGYLYFKAGSLVETSVLLETSSNGTTTAKQLSVRIVAGVLTVTMGNAVPLMNTKIKTISDSNWHLLTIVIDSTQSAANQVLCWLDKSQTGWTAPLSTDLASQTGMMKQKLNAGARNNGASTFFTGSLGVDMPMFTVAHDTSTRQAWENYLTYLYGLYRLPV